MRRLVVDTNVYVDWMNAGRHEDVLFEKGAVKYLSAVVLMELRAGAFRPADRRLLSARADSLRESGAASRPVRTVFAEAGETLRRLQAERGYNLASSPSIVNDVLIALSARARGAVVSHPERRDFRAIQAVRPFALEIVAAA